MTTKAKDPVRTLFPLCAEAMAPGREVPREKPGVARRATQERGLKGVEEGGVGTPEGQDRGEERELRAAPLAAGDGGGARR